MAKLIVPRHTADLEYIIPAIEVYYEAGDWVNTSDYKDRLVAKLLASHKETERNSDETHYTKCSEIPRYFGLLERKEPGKTTSDIRITDSGKEFYTAYINEDFSTIHRIIIEALEKVVFGRNNEGCGSDSDCEAPNVVIISALLLNGVSNKEAAYILGECVKGENLANAVLKVKYYRIENKKIPSSSVTADIKFIPFLKRLGFLTENADGLITVSHDVLEEYKDRLVDLAVANSAVLDDRYEVERTSFSSHATQSSGTYDLYLTALRTKPFMLLAGISGTGKSRLVKELAFMTCPSVAENKEIGELVQLPNTPTTPYNYCHVEVKPNWHDSTELLGYYNALDSKYELTPLIRFVYRATIYPDIPFFVCLDEMNLAPVEQYFAEYLSALETRTLTKHGIVSAALLDKTLFNGVDLNKYTDKDKTLVNYLSENGLQLPNNLYVVGTVNMDDTTHQFSRKVIDRAFTIEMNGGDLAEMFSQKNTNALKYRADEDVVPFEAIKSLFIHAAEIFEEDSPYLKYEETIKETVPSYLNAINKKLKDTPFQVSYRVQNEMILYLAYLIQQNNFPDDIEALTKEAVLAILMEKILPRIQGDDKLLSRGNDKDVFTELSEYVEQNLLLREQTEDSKELVSGSNLYRQTIEKLDQMHKRLENSYFANFF